MMLASSFSILISALAVAARYAGDVPRLQLDISTGDISDGLGVVAKLTNKGLKTVTLFNDPRGILTNAPTNAFEIEDVVFAGIRLKYSPNYILKKRRKSASGSSKFFTVIEPGKSVTVKHDLTSAYSFGLGGERSYKIKAKNLFVYVDENGKAQRVRAKLGRSARMKVTRKKLAKLAKKAKKAVFSKFVKRAGFRGCDDKQVEIIFNAAAAAKELALESLNHLTSNEQATERYTTWWGKMTTARRNKLIDHYTKLSKADYQAFNYDCSCKEEGTFAFVYPDQYGIINLCPAFWQGKLKGTDSQAGTILHETSHFNAIASTEDLGYGQETCKKLAKQSPDEAVKNADSHEYFSENNPEQEKNNGNSTASAGHTHSHSHSHSRDSGKNTTASAAPAAEQEKNNSTASAAPAAQVELKAGANSTEKAVPALEAIQARAMRLSRISRRDFA